MKLGAAGRRRCGVGWEQPRQRRNGSALPDGPGPASKTERCTSAGTSGGTPSSGTPARNLVDLGRSAVRTRRRCWRRATSRRSWVGRPGGHAKACGVVVARLQGKSWAPIPSNGHEVNVGTNVEPPTLAPNQAVSGKAHRQLMARRWGGALVVVRGRESRPHGEGGQQVRSRRAGTSGARR